VRIPSVRGIRGGFSHATHTPPWVLPPFPDQREDSDGPLVLKPQLVTEADQP